MFRKPRLPRESSKRPSSTARTTIVMRRYLEETGLHEADLARKCFT